jgi:serine/alanine adding enzyme
LEEKSNKKSSYRIVTEVSEKIVSDWNRFVQAHPEGYVLQSWYAWQLFFRTKNFNPFFVACIDETDRMVGVLLAVLIREKSYIKFLFSARLVIYGGPLIESGNVYDKEIFRMMLASMIDKTSRTAIFTQFRALHDLSCYTEIFKENGFQWVPRINLLINTQNKEKIFSEMSSSRKRQIRKSLNNGAKVIQPNNIGQVRQFFDILQKLYRQKVRKPLPDWTFFEAFYFLIQKYNFGKYFLIEYKEKIIGGIMAPSLPAKTVFEWYVCGLDPEYKKEGIYPSVLATWAAIEYAHEQGSSVFDFMGVGKPNEPYGVRDFKLRFGGSIVNYGRFIRINNKLKYSIAEFGYNFLSWLKKV